MGKLKWACAVGAIILGWGLTAPRANAAITFGAKVSLGIASGGAYIGWKDPSVGLGGEVSYHLIPALWLGGVFDYNFMSATNGTSGGLFFYGVQARVKPPILGLMIDAQLGLTQLSTALDTSAVRFGFGFGISYDLLPLPFFKLAPRVGYRYLPHESGGSTVGGYLIDLGILTMFDLF